MNINSTLNITYIYQYDRIADSDLETPTPIIKIHTAIRIM